MIWVFAAVTALGWALWAHERWRARRVALLAASWAFAAGRIAGAYVPPKANLTFPKQGYDAFVAGIAYGRRRGDATMPHGAGTPERLDA